MKLFAFKYRCEHCIRLFYEDEVREWLDCRDSDEVEPVCPFCGAEHTRMINYHDKGSYTITADLKMSHN